MNYKKLITAAGIFLFFIFLLVIFTKPAKFKEKISQPPVKGKIAIVIDDWGYHLNNLTLVKQIKYPLTCAVLPNLKRSSFVARNLHDLSFEIILHLPMEPKTKTPLEKDTILAGMDAARIKEILDKDLASVIFAKGISNHMGSKVTEDRSTLGFVMAEAKKKKLYFLDSFVTSKSVAEDIAATAKVKFARRDIFLDNQNDPDYIRGQVIRLKNLARKQGEAIGIGHDRKNTLKVLMEMLPRLEKEGYKLVFVSEIAG